MVLTDDGLTEEALGMIVAEDIAQIEKWGYQEHDIFEWLAIIGLTVGEMNKAILEHEMMQWNHEQRAEKWNAIEKEATQVATLALKMAWMCRTFTNRIHDMLGAEEE